MIRIKAERLTKAEKQFLRYAINYTLDYFIPRKNRKDVIITLDIRPRNMKDPIERDYKGTATHTDRYHYWIWIVDNLINERGKTYKGKFSQIISFLNHELVHVKQFFLREVVEISDVEYKYKGVKYTNPPSDDFMAYFEGPEEIEAYGREKGLDMRFWVHWDEHEKRSARKYSN